MPYDADGNFYNPYSPGTYEYDYEESQRSQPTVELTPEQQAQEIASQNQYRDFLAANPAYVARAEAISAEYNKPQTSWMDSIGYVILAVAPIVIPGIGAALGSAILGSSAASVGAAVGLSAGQVSAAVGASALSAATTALSGGTVEDVIRNAAGAGVSVGLNFGMGGGVSGAVAGSTAGTIVRGGDASQVVTNAFAAGVGAGVQGAMTENPDAGKIVGSAARTYIATGGNVDQTLLSATLTGIGTLDQNTAGTSSLPKTSTSPPVGQSFNYGGNTYQELEDGTAQVTNAKGNTFVIPRDSFQELKEDYANDLAVGAITPSSVAATLQPVNVIGTAQLQDTTYNLLSNGGAEYFDDKGTKRTLSPQEWVVEQSQLGGTVAPTLPPVSVTATTLPPSLDTQILSLMDATVAPTLPPVSVVATTLPPSLDNQILDLISPTTTPTLPPVGVTATTGILPFSPTLPVPTLPGVTIAATSEIPTLPPSLDTKILRLINTTAAPTLPPVLITATTELPTLPPTLPSTTLPPPTLPGVTVSATTELPTLSPTLPVPTLPGVTITATSELPTLPPWWDQLTAVPTLPPVEIVATTELPTLPPTLPPVTISPTTELPTLPPTLPPVVITETTGIPTLPPVVITATTEIPTLLPTLPPPTRTLPPVTITPTTETPTLPPTLPVETTPPVTTLPPATTAPPTSRPTSKPTYPVVIGVTPEPRPRTRAPSTITGASPARLLADALAAYRPAGAIEGEESGKERQNVWNEKSLRLKDALGL